MHPIPLLTLLTSLLSALTLVAALAPTRLIYEAPKGVWYENLAVRPCGSILLTTVTSPNLYLIDPLAPTPTPQLIHRFPPGLETIGITETTTPDTFAVIAANATLKSSHIYTVSFPPPPHNKSSRNGDDVPTIRLVASLPDAGVINGLATLNTTTILASDSRRGAVWAIDTATGASHIALADPLMAPNPNATTQYGVVGINGIRVREEDEGGALYFTNSAQAIFARIPVSSFSSASSVSYNGTTTINTTGPGRSGSGTTAAEVITHALPGGTYDDFALGRGGSDATFLVDALQNSVDEVVGIYGTRGRGGGERPPQSLEVVIANSTEFVQPTSAQFGRSRADEGVLYVTTGTGHLVAVDTTKRAARGKR